MGVQGNAHSMILCRTYLVLVVREELVGSGVVNLQTAEKISGEVVFS